MAVASLQNSVDAVPDFKGLRHPFSIRLPNAGEIIFFATLFKMQRIDYL